MMYTTVRVLTIAALATTCGIAAADSKPPPGIFGLYSGTVVESEEDQIEIAPSIGLGDQSPDTVHVTYRVSGGRDCTFWGYGTWTDGKLVANLGADGPQDLALCRLTLRFSKDTVIVSDPTYNCRRFLCGYAGIDGAVLKKRAR
jgi:hypothetical protein